MPYAYCLHSIITLPILIACASCPTALSLANRERLFPVLFYFPLGFSPVQRISPSLHTVCAIAVPVWLEQAPNSGLIHTLQNQTLPRWSEACDLHSAASPPGYCYSGADLLVYAIP